MPASRFAPSLRRERPGTLRRGRPGTLLVRRAATAARCACSASAVAGPAFRGFGRRPFCSARTLPQNQNQHRRPDGGAWVRVWEVSAGASAAPAPSPGGAERNDGAGRGGACFVPSDDGSGWVEEEEAGRTEPGTPARGTTTTAAAAAALSRERVAELFHRNVLRHFLPAGHPWTVSPGYLPYASHCFVASACGSAAFVLSTQALLLAVGVGDAEAAPVAAALNWVLKDGVGQLGGVLFASRLGSGSLGGGQGRGGSTVDSDPKRWRMVAALALDASALLEILSPLFPGYFLPVASVANVGKNVGFLAAGASRAAIHQSFARSSNLGDVTAKAGSQSIAASLVGTAGGIALSPLVGGDVARVAAGFAALSACHQFCNYRALRSVALDSLNRHRLNLVLDRFVRDAAVRRAEEEDGAGGGGEGGRCSVAGAAAGSSVPSPADVAELESFLPFLSPDDSGSWLLVGCGLRELCPEGPGRLGRLRRICRGGEQGGGDGGSWRYVLSCDIGKDDDIAKAVRLVFLGDADGRDVVRGMLHAHILRKTPAVELEAIVEKAGAHVDEGLDRSGSIIFGARILFSEYDVELLNGLDEQGWRVGDGSVCVEGGTAGRRLAIR